MSGQQPTTEMLESTPKNEQSTVVIPSNLTLTTTTITGNAVTTTPQQHTGIKVIAPSTMNLNTTTTTTTTQQQTTPTSSNSAVPISSSNNTNTATSSTSTTPLTGSVNTAVSSSSPNTPSSPSALRQPTTTTTTTGSTNVSTTSTSSTTTATSTTTPSLSASITLPPNSSLTSANNITSTTHIEYQNAMENKKTLKKIIKASKHWSESVKAYCTTASQFSEELLKHSEQLSPSPKKETHLNVALLSFGHTLKSVNSINDQMLNEVQDVFYTPLNNFVDYDFAEVVESNKRVTKAKDDYDQSLGKISASIKKSKQGIDEGRLFLYEQELEKLKEQYEGSNKDLEIKLAELEHKNETKYLKSLILFINSQYHFYNRASKLFANLKPKLDNIEKYLEEIQPPKVVEGHLMKKSKQVMGGWNKCWYVLKDGMLYCYKGKKEFHPENALNILLCSVRVPQVISSSPMTQQPSTKEKDINLASSQDFRFEILHPRKKQPIVLQAENEEERDRWVQAIQDAISNSLNCQAIENRHGGGGSSVSSYQLGKSLSQSTTGAGGVNSNIGGGSGGSGSGSGGGQSIQADEVNQQVLRILQKVGGNTCCADCNQPDPDWASINLGIIICKVCSGVHRSLGTHISKVRSLTLDKWSPENILFMKEVGNTRFNLLFEHHVSPDVPKPTPQSDRMAKEQWIRAKYKNKEFIIKSTLSNEELSKTMQKNIQDGKRDVLTYLKLLAQGAEINFSGGDDGRSPLHQSIFKSDDVLIPELLLQNGADISLVDPRGWTPMHYAAFFNRPRCANLLMKRGFESVKIKYRDHLSRLAVDLASLNRSKEAEKILRGEEIDTGLNMDNIENNTIPVFEPTVPLSIDFPVVNQEILSDDEEEDQNNEPEIASWSENESSIGRSSFSDTNNPGSNVQQQEQEQQTANTNQTQTINNNSDNNSNNNNNSVVPTLTTTHVLNSSNSTNNLNSHSLANNTNSASNSSSSLVSLTNYSSTGNISNSWVTGSQPNSSNNLSLDESGLDGGESLAPPNNSGGDKKQKVEKDKDYKNSRPKSKRRPSILGKGKNTLRLMRNKWGKKDSDSEDSESESEEAEITKESPPHPSTSSSTTLPPQQSLQATSDNVNNKSTSNLLSSSRDPNIKDSQSSSSSLSSQQQSPSLQSQQSTTHSSESPVLSSSKQSPDQTISHTQSSSSLVNDDQSSQVGSEEKSPSKNSKEGSPTPFKMFLKKLKINKKKDNNGNTVSTGEKRDPSVEDIAELNDIPDNVSVGTNDDSLVSDDSSTSNNTANNKKPKKSKKSKPIENHSDANANE
ncbi:hypothetical protein ACTFIV_006012 [Dictyostelium citrinum]